jgi:hypothetical protein
MKLNRALILIGLLLALCKLANAQAQPDAASQHCQFVMEQATAQKELLETPTFNSGFTQPETGLPQQVLFGATQSLSNERKAGITTDVAQTNCDLYAATQEAHIKIFFALPQIRKDVLEYRLKLIRQTVHTLDDLIADNMKRVDAQNMTKQEIYSLQSAKLRLVADQTVTLLGITTPYVPPQSARPLKDLVADKKKSDVANQKALAHLQKQNNWDVSLSVGVHQQIGDSSSSLTTQTGPYGTVNISYNLASRSINKHLDKSLPVYGEWQDAEFDDVAHQADLLKKQLEESVTIEQSQLTALNEQADAIAQNLKSIENVDTNAALAFRNQLTADQLTIQIDIEDLNFQINELKDYLKSNF